MEKTHGLASNTTLTPEDPALDTLTREELERANREYDEHRQRIEIAPSKSNLLGRFTVVCMVFNRTVGSGIWTVPPKVLVGTGSIGGSLLVWLAAGFIALCGSLCWLEMGLSIPFRMIKDSNGYFREVSTPRSGGEKNFIEYFFKKPKFLATCIYGIMFIVLGNISGNAVAFGIFVAIAAGKDPSSPSNNYDKAFVVGLAILALTVCAGTHMFTRRGGILLNNTLAIAKILVLLIISIMGFIHAGGKYLQAHNFNEQTFHGGQNVTAAQINNAAKTNFDINTSFHTNEHGLASYVESFVFALFSSTGFEQPFYALSEFARPRKVLPKFTVTSVSFFVFLYMLVNVSYYCVVPKEVYLENPSNSLYMASAFFHYLFDETGGPHTAERVMAGLIAFSCFGNIVIITFTAARVKQEIAKQGILPYSLFFATGHHTPWAWVKSRLSVQPAPPPPPPTNVINLEDSNEKAPMAAFVLHWTSSVFLILITIPLKPATQYTFLSALYSYALINILGAFVSGGLLYLKLDSYFRGDRGRNWTRRAGATGYIPKVSPVHAIIYFAANIFMLFASFAKPAAKSAYNAATLGYPWYVLPTVGLSSLLWGLVWWFGLKGTEWKRRKRLVVTRTPYIERDSDGAYVQKAELVEHDWVPVVKGDCESDEGHTTNRIYE